MKPPEFPTIPNIEFKLIPDWPGYAVSSDGRTWNGHGRKWRQMKTFNNFLGPRCVWLLREKPLCGGKVHNVDELIENLFPGE